MERIIVDGENAIFGRLCSFVAKKALEGNEIVVVNSEKTIITGNKIDIIKKRRELIAKGGSARKGPFFPRISYQILKRCIRGMLPDYSRGIGKAALENIKCYNGIPTEFENQTMIKLGKAKPLKYLELRELSEKV
ncbi:MAG: 50S ribosomal protein L13 [Nanoarchaeota archaeon]